MKQTTLFTVVLVGILIAVGIFFVWKQSAVQPSNSILENQAQQITLSMKNANYYPNTITVKENVPVALTLDKSVGGCLRSFTIKDLGVNKYSAQPADTITFTPTKKGTYRFACSMGMGFGTLIVE